ncbi:T9SS type A sorting domain-containing protein [Paraflavitalea sp. CAU 1676]|uniref:T9SS type A sorting domain-containing protein n=1 Tax=Paraflavitalea sp. CAU 1676 TaxID=3032598 RepID=UPI0023DA98C3|nr:T9SS type A sorting domain-containing protein [Paraflavitalea sp. CAU 1676]MDF2187988.1 T9SS type A sorting domain-containing protein [Paraflavitalea sp. CAU 1676]
MKQTLAIIAGLLMGYASIAQQITVGPNGSLVLYSGGSSLSGNGLILTPSAPTTLTGTSIVRNNAVTHPFPNPYVTRVYLIDPTPLLFSGDIQFEYDDSELNGLTETTLQLITYNGTAWQNAGASTVDATNNIVNTTGISNLSLGELALAASLALPLRWGAVTASRQQGEVIIRWTTEQEDQVSHFDVERSTNGQQWVVALSRIPATNQQAQREYRQADRPNHSGGLYYRIRQTDLDGRHTLSKVVRVGPENTIGSLTIHPNPVNGHFVLSGAEPAQIGRIELCNAGGMLLKSWKGYQDRYTMPALSAGNYYLRVQLADGTIQNKQVLVR